jgi:hypothetical protein
MSISKDERKKQTKVSSLHVRPIPPRNPNKRPTKINMKRSIGRMESLNSDVIRQARIREYIKKTLGFS